MIGITWNLRSIYCGIHDRNGVESVIDLPWNPRSESRGIRTLELALQAQDNSGEKLELVIGDCAFGSGATRQKFQDAGIELSAKVAADPKGRLFPKSRFTLDLTNLIATCPAGKISSFVDYRSRAEYDQPVRRLRFSREDCSRCRHYDECLRTVDKKSRWGRTLELHPQEELIQQARLHQSSPEFREDIRLRQTAEQRLARFIHFGARQARYFGKRKTKFQMLMIAIVVNLKRLGTSSSFPRTLFVIQIVAVELWVTREKARRDTTPKKTTRVLSSPNHQRIARAA